MKNNEVLRFLRVDVMHSGLDDLMTVIEWVVATKTPTNNVAAALQRLRERVKHQTPIDLRLHDEHDDSA